MDEAPQKQVARKMSIEEATQLLPTIPVPTNALLRVTRFLTSPSLLMEARVGEIEELKSTIGAAVDAAVTQALAREELPK